MRRDMIQREHDRMQAQMFDLMRTQEALDRDMHTVPAYRVRSIEKQVAAIEDEVRTLGAMINALEGLL